MKHNIVSVILLATMTFTACQQQRTEKENSPVRVRVEKIKAENTVGQLSYVGVVEEGQATVVSYTSMGTIQHVYVSEGQNVKKGALLVRLDDSQARSLLQAAEASNKQAEDAIGRYKQLYEKGSLAEANWVEAQSKLEQARSSYTIAQKNLNDCILRAPCSGVVGTKSLNVGETVLPSQPVVTILNIDTVKIKVSVPEREMAAISANTESTITIDALDGKMFTGGRIEKGVQADALTHTYSIRINVPNEDTLLLPGMVAKVTIAGNAASNVTVPILSVQQLSSGERFVWIVDADTVAHRKMVTIGKTVGNRIVVVDGLKEGDIIITDGFQKISDGSKVEML